MKEIKELYPRVFIDADGNRYNTKDEPIAEGGQGRIYLSSDREIVIKTVIDESLSYEDYEDMLDRTSGILIHPNAGIARPIVKLEKPQKGYVMKFLDGGQSIGSLMKFKSSNISEILEEYNAGGGLKRRLLILKDLAKTLYYIHAAGAVYGDISDKNVFISKVSRENVRLLTEHDVKTWLIDADNIRFERLDGALYTPGFGAPEVVKGQPNTAASDMYSFALLAYVLLNINNPFDGVSIEEDCWDAEPTEVTDEPAEEGGKAFIYDRNDDSNQAGEGMLPWQFGLTEKMLGLFERVFSCKSRKTFLGRPTAAEWYVALSEAVQNTVYCKECNAHHYYNAFPCGGNFDGYLIKVEMLTPFEEDYRVAITFSVVLDGKTSILDGRKTISSLSDISMLSVEVVENRVKLDASKGYTFEVFDAKGEKISKIDYSIGDTVFIIDNKIKNEYIAKITVLRGGK